MTNIDMPGATRFAKTFGTVDYAITLSEVFAGQDRVKAAFSTLPQVSMRFYRDNVIACEGDPGISQSDYECD